MAQEQIKAREINCPYTSCPVWKSGEEWPPQLKVIEDSAENFFMKHYVNTFDFETDEPTDEPTDEHLDLYPFGYLCDLKTYMGFLKQLRDSRGYDVTIRVPGLVVYPLDDEDMEKCGKLLLKLCSFVVLKINEQAKMHDEYYFYQSLVSVVAVSMYRSKLITFTVKEAKSEDLKTVRACLFCELPETKNGIEYRSVHLHGWNFKPDDSPPSSSKRQSQKRRRKRRAGRKRKSICKNYTRFASYVGRLMAYKR